MENQRTENKAPDMRGHSGISPAETRTGSAFVDPSEPVPVTNERFVAQELRRRKRDAKLMIRQKAVTYCHDFDASMRLAASIGILPFDASSIGSLPVAFREILHSFLVRVLLLYILSCGTRALCRSSRTELAAWARRIIQILLDLLNLEASPSLTIISEALDWFEASTTTLEHSFCKPKSVATGTPKKRKHWKRKKQRSEGFDQSCIVNDESSLSGCTVTSNPTHISEVTLQYPINDDTTIPPSVIPLHFHEMINPQPLKVLLLSEGSPCTALQLVINNTFQEIHTVKSSDVSGLSSESSGRCLTSTPVSEALSPCPVPSTSTQSNAATALLTHTSVDIQVSRTSSYDEEKTSLTSSFATQKTSSKGDPSQSPRLRCSASETGFSRPSSPRNNTPHIDYFFPEDAGMNLAPSMLPDTEKQVPPPAVAVVLRDLFLLCILHGHLDARLLLIFRRTADALDLPSHALVMAVQERLALELIQGSMRKDTKESARAKNIRRLKVAGVAVGLGALTAVTAGLAAPAIAAGFGALGIAGMSGTAAFLATTGGSATVASVFGAGTAGFSGWKYFRRIGKIKVFQFDKLQPCLGITILRDTASVSESSQPSGDETKRANAVKAMDHRTSHSTLSLPLALPASRVPPASQMFHDNESESLLYLDAPAPGSCTPLQTTPINRSNSETALLGQNPIASQDQSAGSIPRAVSIREPSCRIVPLPPSLKYTNSRLPSSDSGRRSAITPNTPPSLTVTVCVSGWLRRMSDVWKPWRGICSSATEVYALRWDPTILLDLGTFMLNILSQRFAVTAANLWLQTTIAGALTVALMWPIALIQYASGLDNTWMVCRERATQSGRLLAEAINDEKTVGSRPVSLIGFSMGARVIYACLLELHRLKALHRVTDVILIGAPVSCDKTSWQRAREVVSGRLVNVYSRADWLLGFLYRYMEWGITVAGLSEIKVEGVENVDVTGIVRSHGQYADKLQDILAYVGYHALHRQTQSAPAPRKSALPGTPEQSGTEDARDSSPDYNEESSLQTTLLSK